MIEWGKSISDKHCYELDSGLYFDVSTVPEYGRLARAVTEDGEARIDEVDGKRNAADFAIWRKTPAGETRQMEWDSPWGKGAPGWHLECSVMSKALLGLPFDIHTGGIDHREIHHPNEIAQNQAHEGCADSGARIWMHNNFLIERSGKMSKSSGEFLRLQLLIDKGFHPLAYRLMCLQAHYRSELEFSWEGLQAALVRLKRMVARVPSELFPDMVGRTQSKAELAENKARFDAAISADLNTPEAITVLEDLLASKQPDHVKRQIVQQYDEVLGLNLMNLRKSGLKIRPKSASITDEEITRALREREEARSERDFLKADTIRAQLMLNGVEVMDGYTLGWDWKLDV
jgi:cysteinyl-tRNA synthetase